MAQDTSRGGRWLRIFVDLAVIVLLVAVGKTAIAEAFFVPSGSMEPTLLIGDGFLATKYPYGYSAASLPAIVPLPQTTRIWGALPKRGDVVVFRWPGDRSQTWVKRVIGLPGDRIALRNGRVSINGVPVGMRAAGNGRTQTEDGATIPVKRFIETLPDNREHAIFKAAGREPLDNIPETVVPPGHLFVMGDNRDNSSDSRVKVADGGVGMLPVEALVGRVDGIVGSWDLAMRREPVWNWPKGLRLSRFFSAVQ